MNVDAVFGALGRFSVRFRWVMVVAWLVVAVACAHFLPSLASVTQSNNTKFLPASAPVEKATALAAPFGTANLMPIPVVVARTGGPLTAADLAAVSRLEADFKTVPDVNKVINLGSSPLKASVPGQAQQLLVLVGQLGGNQSGVTTLVGNMRARIAQAGLPSGLQAHLTGSLAVQVDQQKANGNQGSKIQYLSALFIILLLVLIFRSFTLALTTLIPAFISVTISGPLVAEAAHHGLQVSPIAQLLMIVLVLGAGTDYGLFLVFRVREELRNEDYYGGPLDREAAGGAFRAVLSDLRRPRDPARAAIVAAVTRVGESIAFSAATVIAAVLTLLLATFAFYADLGIPFAIAIVVTLIAALTLLPALLSIRLSLLGAKRTLFQRWFGKPKLLRWDFQGAGKAGIWGKVANRIVQRPVATLLVGIIFFGALAFGVTGYKGGGFGGSTSAPRGSDSAAGQTLLTKYFPQASANPTNLIFTFSKPVWADPAVMASATSQLHASSLFTQVTGPLNPVGVTITPTQYAELHGALGSAKALPPVPPTGSKIPPEGYQLYRATSNYVSPDGKTILFSVGLAAGDPGSTTALNAVPAIRAETTRVAGSAGVRATDSGVAGEAPALYDISSISDHDLKHIIPIAILVIGLLLAIVLRSLVAPLYLIASVGVSYLAALGLSVLLFIKIGGSGGLVFFLPFLMFIFLLALGEDYNILVMTRIREEAHKLPLRQAVAKAVGITGTTVTSAGLVLAGTFMVLAIVGGTGPGGSSQILDIGIGLALGILMDTFLVRTLLVPSTVVLLGRWNWWPSKIKMDRPEQPESQPEVLTAHPDHVG
jgi:putative drug exporter of the RND superfamily